MRQVIFSSLFLLALLLSSCESPVAPEFQKLENVKFKSATISQSFNFILTADALFHNPNSLGIEVTALDLELFVNEKKVSNIKQNVSTSINQVSDFKLPLEFEVPLRDVINEIKPSLGQLLKKPEINYLLTGKITMSMAGVKVKVPMEYEGKEKLKLPGIGF